MVSLSSGSELLPVKKRLPVCRHPPSPRVRLVYIEHLRIPVGPGALHVERLGRGGAPVVLLHGFGTSAFLWRRVAPLLAAAGYTALSFDLLGYGESDRPLDAGYGLVTQAEYLDRALTALRLPKAVVVGQGVGALVALQLAARRPERIERLFLINPVDPNDLPGAEIRALQRAAARIVLGAHGLFGASQVLAPFLRESAGSPGPLSDLLVARYTAPYLGDEGLSHLLLLARSLELEDDEQLQLSAVKAPVALAVGKLAAREHLQDAERIATELRASGQSTDVMLVPDAGFLPAEDQPVALASRIRDWINVSKAADVEKVSQAGELSPES